MQLVSGPCFLALATLFAAFSLACGGGDEPAPVSEESVSSAPAPPPPDPEVLRGEVALLTVRVAEGEASVANAEEALGVARGELAEVRRQLAAAEAGLAAAEALAPRPSDGEIFRLVQKALLEAPALAQVAIAAEVSDGTVTLRGRVPDEQTRAAALAVAGAAKGVRGVDDQIRLAD